MSAKTNYEGLKTSLRAVNRKNVAKILRNMQHGKKYRIESFTRFFADSSMPYQLTANTLNYMYRYGLLNRADLLNRDSETKQARGNFAIYTLSSKGEDFLYVLDNVPNLTYNNTPLRNRAR